MNRENTDIIKNQIGGYVNNLLMQDKVTPNEMRYILKSILGEVAEMELTQNYIAQMRKEQQKEENVE